MFFSRNIGTILTTAMQMEINRSFKRMLLFCFPLLKGGIKCIAADSNPVLKWCLNRADQTKNTSAMEEMTGIYSSLKKYESLRPSQILISKKLVAEVISVLEEEYIILLTNTFLIQKLGKKLALSIATERLKEDGA